MIRSLLRKRFFRSCHVRTAVVDEKKIGAPNCRQIVPLIFSTTNQDSLREKRAARARKKTVTETLYEDSKKSCFRDIFFSLVKKGLVATDVVILGRSWLCFSEKLKNRFRRRQDADITLFLFFSSGSVFIIIGQHDPRGDGRSRTSDAERNEQVSPSHCCCFCCCCFCCCCFCCCCCCVPIYLEVRTRAICFRRIRPVSQPRHANTPKCPSAASIETPLDRQPAKPTWRSLRCQKANPLSGQLSRQSAPRQRTRPNCLPHSFRRCSLTAL